jgi:CRISPR-associated endonuclease/helicase Cas3
MPKYIAHKDQDLYEHLEIVAELAKIHAEKIGMGKYGELLGLLHDFGKYSDEFQKYIKDALKRNDPEFNPDEDEDFADPTGRKGKIDHSTAGAQFLAQKNGSTNVHKILGQYLSLCLVSHHSGLIDCLTTDNKGTWDSYSRRLSRPMRARVTIKITDLENALPRKKSTFKSLFLCRYVDDMWQK